MPVSASFSISGSCLSFLSPQQKSSRDFWMSMSFCREFIRLSSKLKCSLQSSPNYFWPWIFNHESATSNATTNLHLWSGNWNSLMGKVNWNFCRIWTSELFLFFIRRRTKVLHIPLTSRFFVLVSRHMSRSLVKGLEPWSHKLDPWRSNFDPCVKIKHFCALKFYPSWTLFYWRTPEFGKRHLGSQRLNAWFQDQSWILIQRGERHERWRKSLCVTAPQCFDVNCRKQGQAQMRTCNP